MSGGPQSIAITGIGVVSPAGHSAAALAERVCRPESALVALTDMGIAGAFGAGLGDIPLDGLPADSRTRVGRLDRLCRLFLAASYRAVADAGLEMAEVDAPRVGLSFGTAYGCLLTNAEYYEKIVEQGPAAASPRLFAYTVSSAAAGEVSIALGIKGPNLTAHAGFAAGLQAVGYGVDLLRSGKADIVLAGGADALGPPLVRGLADMGLLKAAPPGRPFRDTTPGIQPSEGAAVFVLERGEQARRRGIDPIAHIEGWTAGFEPTLTRHEREADGIIATLRRAAAALAVDFVVSSAHGTEIDRTEGLAVDAAWGSHRPLLLAPKAVWGECAAASGVLGVALAAELLRQPRALSDGVAWRPDGTAIDAAGASAHLRRSSVAAVHALCYSGATVALLLARQD